MNDPVLAGVFYLVAAITVLSALGVVLTRHILYAALSLVISFAGVAAVFVLLSADFLAAVQLLIYGGAIAVLIIFAIMMTQNPLRGSTPNEQRWPAFILAGLMLVVLLAGAAATAWPLSSLPPPEATTAPLGRLLLNEFVLPFEVASVLLVAAMIGAIVIARDD